HPARIAAWSHFLFSGEVLAGCVLAALLYVALDGALVATVISVQTATNVIAAWQANMRTTILTEITESAIGIIAACIYTINPLFVIVVALPVAMTHVTKRAIRRLEHEPHAAVTARADAIDHAPACTDHHFGRR